MHATARTSIDGSVLEFSQWAMYALKPIKQEEVRFCRLVSLLGRAARTNYGALGRAYDDGDQVMMAWSCRNLLELGIITRFVLQSKTNAEEFEADRFIDAHEIAIAVKGIYDAVNPFPDKPDPSVNESIAVCLRVMKEQGVTRSKFLSLEKLAKQVGLYSDFKNMNKLCSKLVHPTSWLIFDERKSLTEFPSMNELFFLFGAKNLAIVLGEIKQHVKDYGLQHKA